MKIFFYFLSSLVKWFWNFLRKKNQNRKEIQQKTIKKQEIEDTKEFIKQIREINPEMEDELQKLEKIIEEDHIKPEKFLPKTLKEFIPTQNSILFQKYSSI